MEIACQRCRRVLPEDSCFCPSCGLPQLTYGAEEFSRIEPDAVTASSLLDAGAVDWKRALRLSLLLAIPSGILMLTLGVFGAFLMLAVAAAVVLLYLRNRQPAWLTTSAGMRIGLVTGVFAGWTAVAAAGLSLYAARFWMHQGKIYDDLWTLRVVPRISEQLAANGWPQQMVAQQSAMMLSPDGQAGYTIGVLLLLAGLLLPFAAAGGALGVRLAVRSRRSRF